MSLKGPSRRVEDMKRTALLTLFAAVLLLLALGGWIVDGMRWLGAGGRQRQLAVPA